MNLPESAINRILAIESAYEYNELMELYRLSPSELSDEACRFLRASKPQFDTSDKSPTAELIKQIKDGEADISDMGGFQ